MHGDATTSAFGSGSSFARRPRTSFTSIFAFDLTDGSEPYADLINVNGRLYGTTRNGGVSNLGTVFEIDPSTGTERVVHSFNGASGAEPYATLTNVNGKLYGTTRLGGASHMGTVFAIGAFGTERVVHTFTGTNGSEPYAGLINVNGRLYGTTRSGGAGGSACPATPGQLGGCGTVFDIDPSTGVERVVHSFNGGTSDGAEPYAGLTFLNGKLYGTTNRGTANSDGYNYGTVFEIDPSTGAERVVHSFNFRDGAWPYAGLINVNGKLYGTTFQGGAPAGFGTVFEINPSTGTERVVHGFSYTDGAELYAGLTFLNGRLYGTARTGGEYRGGVVFEIDLTSSSERVLYSFSGTDGRQPYGGLTFLNGKLYGTTRWDARRLDGTVFELIP